MARNKKTVESWQLLIQLKARITCKKEPIGEVFRGLFCNICTRARKSKKDALHQTKRNELLTQNSHKCNLGAPRSINWLFSGFAAARPLRIMNYELWIMKCASAFNIQHSAFSIQHSAPRPSPLQGFCPHRNSGRSGRWCRIVADKGSRYFFNVLPWIAVLIMLP